MRSTRLLTCCIAAALATASLAACSSSSSGPSSSGPILIGASLPLTGDFSADGVNFERGYDLWMHDVNAAGGILGRKVKMIILNDASQVPQVQADYTKLISVDHVSLVFGPFSSLLTAPADNVVARNGLAFIEGAGGSPLVFNAPPNKADHNIFDVSLPVASYMVPFANYLASLPASRQPKTAAYPMADDIFGYPPVQAAEAIMAKAGIKTVYSKIFPEETPDYAPAATQVAAKQPDVVALGSTDVPTVAAFMKVFEQQHYVPKYFIAASGPDQGSAFTSVVGMGNANGMMVPNGWYPGINYAGTQQLISEYIAKYHGSQSSFPADAAEAYSVGQVAEQAIKATGGTDNAKIIRYLHSGATLTSVQGPVKFDSLGRNTQAVAFIFQWQNGKYVQVLPANSAGSVTLVTPKPAWTGK
jgi:branched-chain amino acid transport system substrate-binding protein